MASENIPTETLCFYKLTLLKGKDFEGRLIDFNYLEKLTKISEVFLFEPLRHLVVNKIIIIETGELDYGYITAYRTKRREFEATERRKQIGGLESAHYNPNQYQKSSSWETYYNDQYCNLGKDNFEKLKKQKKIDIRIDNKIFEKAELKELLLYFKFKLKINNDKLKKYLDEYLNGFIKNKFNSGDKFAYSKQAKDISVGIHQLIEAGYPEESLLIDSAQIFPKNKVVIRPTDGHKITSILLYDFVGTVLAMEKEKFFEVLDIQYQKEVNRLVSYSDLLWEDPIKIRLKLSEDFTKLSLKYLDPDAYKDIAKLEQRREDYENNPKKFQKIREENAKRKKAKLESIYVNINYSDKAERKAWEKKWDVLQNIWDAYVSANKPTRITTPTNVFIIKNRSEAQIEDIFNGLLEEGAVAHWYKKYGDYIFIIPEELNDAYKKTKDVYQKFANEYKIKKSAKKQNGNDIIYDYNTNSCNGSLKIGDFPELPFGKKPALILDYFYKSYQYDSSAYKNAHDFNKSYKFESKISTSDFSKRINKINKRVCERTNYFIKEIINKKEKSEVNPKTLNHFRWQKKT